MKIDNIICTPNENRTRVTRMKILGTNHYTMGAFQEPLQERLRYSFYTW